MGGEVIGEGRTMEKYGMKIQVIDEWEGKMR